MREYLCKVEWEKELGEIIDSDEYWEVFTSHMNIAKSNFIPTKK